LVLNQIHISFFAELHAPLSAQCHQLPMVKDAWAAGADAAGNTSRELRFFSRSYGEKEKEEEGKPQAHTLAHDENGLPLKLKLEQKFLTSSVLMGKCRRNPITGEISLEKPPSYPNFQIVDLAGRDVLPKSRRVLETDPYLFKVIPLMYRTWLYQCHFLKPESMGRGKDLDYVVRKTLDSFCLDLAMWDCRWSPMMVYALIMFLSSLTCSSQIIIAVCCVGILSVSASMYCNTPKYYRKERWLTLPARIGLFVYVALMFPSETVLEAVGAGLVLILVLLEVWAGDLTFFSTYRFHCSYKIMKCIGGRVYVCEREGAMGMNAYTGREADKMAPHVSTLPKWTVMNHIIAELEGLMVELRPMSPEDWRRAAEDFSWNLTPVTFVSLPICEYEGAALEEADFDEGQDHIPKKMARGAVRGTQYLETLQTFRQAREIYGGNEHLDWMIEDLDYNGS